MSVVKLGLNCQTDFLLYEDTPIFVEDKDLFKIQGAIDVRSLLGTVSGGGLIIEAKAFSNIPNLIFTNSNNQKIVKSAI